MSCICHLFRLLRFGTVSSLILLDFLTITDQLLCRMSLSLDLSDVLLWLDSDNSCWSIILYQWSCFFPHCILSRDFKSNQILQVALLLMMLTLIIWLRHHLLGFSVQWHIFPLLTSRYFVERYILWNYINKPFIKLSMYSVCYLYLYCLMISYFFNIICYYNNLFLII